MNHDIAPWRPPQFPRVRFIRLTRIGDMEGFIKTTFCIATIDAVNAFRCFLVAFKFLFPHRLAAECDFICFNCLAVMH